MCYGKRSLSARHHFPSAIQSHPVKSENRSPTKGKGLGLTVIVKKKKKKLNKDIMKLRNK